MLYALFATQFARTTYYCWGIVGLYFTCWDRIVSWDWIIPEIKQLRTTCEQLANNLRTTNELQANVLGIKNQKLTNCTSEYLLLFY